MQKVKFNSATAMTAGAVCQTSFSSLCHLELLQPLRLSPDVQVQFRSAVCVNVCDSSLMLYTLRVLKLDFHCFPRTLCQRWTRASSPLRDKLKACFLFFWASGKATQKLAGPLMLSPPFGPVSTRYTWLPLADKAMERSTRTDSWDRQRLLKGEETTAVSYVFGPNVAPLTVRRISSLCVMNSRRISRLTRRVEEAVWLPLPKHQKKRKMKGRRRKEHWVNAGSSISLKGRLDCAGLRHLSKHKLL